MTAGLIKYTDFLNKPVTLLILFFLILVLAGFLRVYHLASNPVGFFCDEASIGYNAYLLFMTGRDEYGKVVPMFFKSFGVYRPPIFVYSTVPFVALLGLSELAVRIVSILYGMLTVTVMYFLGSAVAPKKKVYFGLLCSLIAATMPWLIHYNRIGFELNSYVAFFAITILLFLKSTRNARYIIPAFIVSGITLYTYQAAHLLVPLIIVGFLSIYRKSFVSHKKIIIVGFLCFFLISIPLLYGFLNGQALARFTMVSVFSAHLTPLQLIARIGYNYIVQLSPSYFIIGEPTPITRHFINGLTPLLFVTIPFLLLGILKCAKTFWVKKSSQLLLFWLFIYPIAGAVTAEGPFTSRSIIGAPLFVLFIAIGIEWVVRLGKTHTRQMTIFILIVAMIVLNLISFSRFYFIQYPLDSAGYWGWQYGPRDIVTYFDAHQSEYDDLVMAPEFNAPDIFFKFYAPHGCKKCLVGLPENFYVKGKNQLFALTPLYIKNNPQYTYRPVKSIIYPNGNTAFTLMTIE